MVEWMKTPLFVYAQTWLADKRIGASDKLGFSTNATLRKQ